MKIALAEPHQAAAIGAVYDACRAVLARAGVHQWTSTYPSRGTVADDIARACLYVCLDGAEPAAVVTLDALQEPEYADVAWRVREGPVLVVHRLAVHPDYQRRGLATRLMDFAEAHARQHVCAAIRLDAFSGNPGALGLYERRGYARRGLVYFSGRDLPFHCFEKAMEAV